MSDQTPIANHGGETKACAQKLRVLDLKGGHRVTLDEADWPLVCDLTIYRGMNGYAYFSKWVDGRSRPRTLHSLLIGQQPGMHIDHINGDRLDNRRENLRVVTPQINQVNRRSRNKNNTSGVRGVVHARPTRPKPWRAQIMVSRKHIFLGEFATIEEAAAARRAAEIQYYGEVCP